MIITLKNIVLFLLATFATLLVCELFIGNGRIVEASLGKYYDDIGKGLPNNHETVLFTEGFGIFKTNNSRFAGREIDTNTTRHINIALIGDSFVEAFQIFQRDYFGNLIEKNLSERFPAYTFKVQNFGRANFNLNHNYAYQRVFVDSFKPELVLYFVSNGDLHLEELTPLYPYTKLVNDSLVTSVEFDKDEVERYKLIQKILGKSILLNMLKNAKHATKKRPIASTLFGKIYDWFAPVKQLEPIDNNYTPLPLANTILKNLDNNVIIVNRDSSPLYKSFENEINRLGITYWDTSGFVDSLYQVGKDPYYWEVTKTHGHWNQEMHIDLGSYLSKKLIRKIEQDSLIVQN